MKKQTVLGFWCETLVAFILLAAIVFIGATSCTIRKITDPIPSIKWAEHSSLKLRTDSLIVVSAGDWIEDTLPFHPATGHSEIKEAETVIVGGNGLTIYSPCENGHIWVQTVGDTIHNEDRGIAISKYDGWNWGPVFERDKDYDTYEDGINIVCIRCYEYKRQIIHTKYFKTEKTLTPTPIFPSDVRITNTCDSSVLYRICNFQLRIDTTSSI
jgi:hypothetical protein